MATIKIDYTGQCAGGGHSHLRVMLNGVERRVMTVQTEEMVNPPRITEGEADAFLMTLLRLHRRKWLKANPTGTNGQYIAALEAEEWEI